ncbi:MAG TPA: hypothetical protein VFH43_11600 [Candidatus Kapabacteria bacterium]|nr:hypothetical protein [Candidatus Kapabacteria bacterium]
MESPSVHTQSRTSTMWMWLFGLMGFGLLLLQAIDYINFAVDDVFITLRVAQNAANGLGLVFNAGEYVEGYSNFLWTVMLAGIAWISGTSFEQPYVLLWIAKGLSFAAGLLAIFFLYKLARLRMGSSFFSLLAVLALIGTGPFVLWMCGGLEGTFYATLLVVCLYVVEQYKRTSQAWYLTAFGIAAFMTSITRPEALMHSGVMFVAMLVMFKGKERMLLIVRSMLPYAALMGIFLMWRWVTYHDILPNTFYAKTGGGLTGYILGVKYLLAGMVFIAGPFLLAIPLTIARGVRSDVTVRVGLGLILSTAFFVSYSNGDWMAGFRFVMPLAPILILFGIESIKQFAGKLDLSNRSQMIPLACVTLVVLSGMIFSARQMTRGSIQTMPTGFSHITGHATGWHEEIGNWLRENTDGRRTIATGEAGMMAYLNPNTRLIDLYGLLDRYIAHTKKDRKPLDPNYVFDQKPDYILLYGTGEEATIVSYSHNSDDYLGIIQSSPRFRQEYQLKKKFISLDLYERKP